jgi:beta-phosphoglucomutase-like phosphatase (HAD superfamily)
VTLGLPTVIRACLFDLDGVITDSTSLHAAAWREAFDTLLQQTRG